MRPVKVLALSLAGACALGLAAGSAAAQSASPETLGFKKHFTVEIVNPSALTLENQAVILDVAEIRAAVAPDFNTYMYALFEVRDGNYNFVVTQADDLDKDRYHDEIVLVRTLPPSSTTRLVCYYTPNGSFNLMPTAKAFARGAWAEGGPEAAWESNLVGFEFVHGAIGVFGKLQPGLILKGFPAALAKKEWGEKILEPGRTAGAGGLSVWDGVVRIPLYGPAAPPAKITVISPGPVRGLVKAEYSAVKTASGDIAVTVYYSAFAENIYSRQDVVVTTKASAPVILGPGVPSLSDVLSTTKFYWAVWGMGSDQAGDIGVAVIIRPADDAGAENPSRDEFFVKLKARAGRRTTYWVAGAWERGATATPDSKAWGRRVDDLAARLNVPVKVEYKAK